MQRITRFHDNFSNWNKIKNEVKMDNAKIRPKFESFCWTEAIYTCLSQIYVYVLVKYTQPELLVLLPAMYAWNYDLHKVITLFIPFKQPDCVQYDCIWSICFYGPPLRGGGPYSERFFRASIHASVCPGLYLNVG